MKAIRIPRILAVIVFYLAGTLSSIAQAPTHYPKPTSEPVGINLVNVLVFFVLPIVLFGAYLIIRRRARKNKL